ncbi:MAG: saccharopine dehydrogenase C-terminal domain-containing protein [Rhodothermales bacterium]
MRITVIGAGLIGSAIARELNDREGVTQIQILDARARSLQELHAEIKSSKLRSFQVDVRDFNVLEPILRGSDCVIGCALPEVNPILAETCLNLGIHFCDLGGNDEIVEKELALHDRARQKSVWIVPNCGLAPGLVNVLCLAGIEQFDEVEFAHLRVGDVPLYPEPPFNFRISWSAEKIIDDYTHPVQLIEKGKVRTAEPLSRLEPISFPEPFGSMESFCTAGGLSTLTDELADKVKTLDHKTIRWPGHANQMHALLELGFGEDRSIDVRTHLTYRDILVRRMRKRLGGTYEDAVLMRVVIKGKKDGEKKTLVYEMVDLFDRETEISAMKRCTSIPAAAAAYLIATGSIKGGGAVPPENCVPKEEYLKIIAERGLDISTSWYDGYVDVRHPGVRDPSGSGDRS